MKSLKVSLVELSSSTFANESPMALAQSNTTPKIDMISPAMNMNC